MSSATGFLWNRLPEARDPKGCFSHPFFINTFQSTCGVPGSVGAQTWSLCRLCSHFRGDPHQHLWFTIHTLAGLGSNRAEEQGGRIPAQLGGPGSSAPLRPGFPPGQGETAAPRVPGGTGERPNE